MKDEAKSISLNLRFESLLVFLILGGGLPGLLLGLVLLWSGDYSFKTQWSLTVVVIVAWLFLGFAARERIVHPLRTVSSLLAALREGDYSFRGRGGRRDDVLGEIFLEANTLGKTLRDQRLNALEATALLRTVMSEIDVAIFTFDRNRRLRLVNRASERLMAQQAEELLGQQAEELGLAECLDIDSSRALEMTFPGGAGRWGVRVGRFWQEGLPHQLLVLSDLTRALREEELQAWKRLVRVLGHELNNSLTPIRSIANSLKTLVERESSMSDGKADILQGLAVISGRAEALTRFMQAYARLAKLPPPKKRKVSVPAWVQRVIELETRMRVGISSGPDLDIRADGDQLEQLLINLVRNAVDAAQETGGGVQVGWRVKAPRLEVWVQDEGPGLPESSNLFVPFFTTKAGGSGIGLVLSRQVAEAHGGTLTLENSTPGPGCIATLRLPV